MKKLSVLFLALFTIQSNASSQPCLQNGIEFTTQEAIDNFQSDYPNCTQIEGFVKIHGDDITNLNGLNMITEIGEFFWIIQNDLLPSFSGFENLSYVGGSIEIINNNLLNSLEGLNNLETVGGNLYISNNPALSNLFGLNSVTLIEGNLILNQNYGLTTLSGLENLSQIGGDLSLLQNDLLINLDGINNVSSIGGWLQLEFNSNLSNLSALENLTSVNGTIAIFYNSSLNSLSGIDNIDPNTIESIKIEYNDFLSICHINSICNYITTPFALVSIWDNATGCFNVSQVEDSCDVSEIFETDFLPEIKISPNPAKNVVNISTLNGFKILEVNIYNQLGQKVLQQTGSTEMIDISALKQSIYIIEIVSNDFKIKEKLLVNK